MSQPLTLPWPSNWRASLPILDQVPRGRGFLGRPGWAISERLRQVSKATVQVPHSTDGLTCSPNSGPTCGVLACSVAQRTREIGVRMALGAEAGRLRGMVLRQVGGMVTVGSLIGLAAALGLGRAADSPTHGAPANRDSSGAR